MTPDQVLKGRGSGTTERFKAALRSGPFGQPTLLKNQELILFGAKGPKTGEWTLLNDKQAIPVESAVMQYDRSHGFAPPLITSASDSPLQKTIKEVGGLHAISPSNATLEMLMPLGWSRVETETTAMVFRMFLNIPNSNVKKSGLIGLTTLGLLEAVVLTDQVLASGTLDTTEQLALIEQFYDSDDPEAMKVIRRWLQSPEPTVRATAAGILAKHRSRDAVLLLGGALDDSDFEVRWRAVGGLSAFANHIPPGSIAVDQRPWPLRTGETIQHSVFDRNPMVGNEGYYLQFWRSWWKENRERVDDNSYFPPR